MARTPANVELRLPATRHRDERALAIIAWTG
jgi:hypothetical protein